MQTFPTAFKLMNDGLSKQPIYAFEILWSGGGEGTEGVNDIYFTTCDISNVLNFPYPTRWFPVLDSDSISGISQSVDPINGVSTIGQLSVTITDFGGIVSDIIKAADVAGHGLRRQRCEVYMLFKGMDWADRVKVRTMCIEDLKLAKYNQYTLSCSDIQSQMRKTVFNPAKTKLTANVAAAGAVTLNVNDTYFFNLVDSVKLGSVGFVLISDEIMYFTAKTSSTLTVPAIGRGMYGSVAVAHTLGDTVEELIYLNENPITMALKILESSGTALANGAYDKYPAAWGCNMKNVDAIDEAGWLQIGEMLTGLSTSHLPSDGLQFEFLLKAGDEAKKFIEDSILKIIGAFGFVRGDGSYSIRAYNDLANASKENAVAALNENNIVSWGDLNYSYTDLANEMWIEHFEYPRLSGKYLRVGLFTDSVSQKKWGTAKQLRYTADGISSDEAFIDQLYQRFQRVMARYSRPPMRIQLTLMPKMQALEIGDIVRVSLPIRDLVSGANLDRAFEIVTTSFKPKTGEVVVDCIAQPEVGARWFGGGGEVASVVISPAATSIPISTTQQLVAQCFNGNGAQIPTPAISWVATGSVTVSSTGLVTAGGSVGTGSVYAVVGIIKSNTAAITITAAANTNPVASVVVSPSSTTLQSGDTKLVTAIAKDVSSNQVNGVTFNWLSSNPAIATVPLGPSISATVTAVADGVTNITATETVSLIASPAMPVTVAALPPAQQSALYFADAAYQVGTYLNETDARISGPPGGPYTIDNGADFASGSYWFDNSVLLASTSTCTINGTVRFYSYGTVTINGTVDGIGRGGAAAISGVNYIFAKTIVTLGDFYYAKGNSSFSTGFLGRGGIGGYGNINYPSEFGTTKLPLNQNTPNIDIIGTTPDIFGKYTFISGVPTNTQGGGGSASGPFLSTRTAGHVWDGAAGGNGGSGFVIVSRGVNITIGQVLLNGANSTFGVAGSLFCGGAGGGGSFIALAERGIGGLDTKSIDPLRINTSAGIVIGETYDPSFLLSVNASIPATPGCFIQQNIPI